MDQSRVPWKKIYHAVLSCGNEHQLENFCIKVLAEAAIFCPYDQALVYFLDGNGRIYHQRLVNMDERWNHLYLVYYFQTANGRYDCGREFRENPSQPPIQLREWAAEPGSEFLADYIQPCGIQQSLGFPLYDIYGRPRTVFALDRLRGQPYGEQELRLLSLLIPQLNNLHKNFFCFQEEKALPNHIDWDDLHLTRRETEVAKLLCEGALPASIAKALYISQSTTYKHIAHIYRKLNVTSRQELMISLLG